tara:strand:- start:385 stop:639 length:255 start_codon:yes stop_codon:yes gene_type:complete
MLNSVSFQGKNMARSLKLLEGLPIELQEAILEEISLATKYLPEEKYKEINIDGEIFVIHETVLGLIDGLVVQLEKMKSEISANK